MKQSEPRPVDIPIIFCDACNQAPMVARSINRHLLDGDVIDIDFECPKCGAQSTKRVPTGSDP